jgi:hypothetical protein
MRWRHWVIFGAVEITGFVLPIVIFIASPVTEGSVFLLKEMWFAMLLPGSLITLLLPLHLSRQPLVATISSVILNALLVYASAKLIQWVRAQDKIAAD